MAKFRMQAIEPGKFKVQYKRKLWPFWSNVQHQITRLERGYSTIYETVWVDWTGTEKEAQRFINDLTKREQVYK